MPAKKTSTASAAPKLVREPRKKSTAVDPPHQPSQPATPLQQEQEQDFAEMSKKEGKKPVRANPSTHSTARQAPPVPANQPNPPAQPDPPAQPTRGRGQQAPPKPADKPQRTPLVNIRGNLTLDGVWNLRCYEYKYVTECLQLHRFPTDSTPATKAIQPEHDGQTESNKIINAGGILTTKSTGGDSGVYSSGGGAREMSNARDDRWEHDDAEVPGGFDDEHEITPAEEDVGSQPDERVDEPEDEERNEYVIKTAGVKPGRDLTSGRPQAPPAASQESSSKQVENASIAGGDVVAVADDQDLVPKVENESEEGELMEDGESIASAKTEAVQPATPEEEEEDALSSPEAVNSQLSRIDEEDEVMENDESEGDTPVVASKQPGADLKPPPTESQRQPSNTEKKRDPVLTSLLSGAVGSGHPLNKAKALQGAATPDQDSPDAVSGSTGRRVTKSKLSPCS